MSVNTNPMDSVLFRFLKIQDNQPKETTTSREAGTLMGKKR